MLRTTISIAIASTTLAAGAAAAQTTPAARAIATAQAALAKDPTAARAGVDLAFAYARRARETSDPAYYERGHEAAARVLARHPDDFEAQKARAWLLLGQHRFAEALALASALNKRVPDDVTVYGLMTDAAAELGNYDAAEASAQWMLNLRPGNVPALTRAAYLRETFGDVDGALELMAMALDQTPYAESEERAWLLTQTALLELSRGRVAAAESALDDGLAAFPEYHYALGALARVRTAQGRIDDALACARRHYAASPHPENLYLLAEALERAGRAAEAKRTFADFERQARAEMNGPDNANRELVFYYLDHAGDPVEGLRLARHEASVRHDVHTRHALAWALHRNGRFGEALAEIRKALDVGVKDERMVRHEKEIAQAAAHEAVTSR
jgi:tetratricopeptide (TPR) repeat protein